MAAAKVGKVPNRLRKTLSGLNKVHRTQAVAQAVANVEDIREDLTGGLLEEVSKLHRLALHQEEYVSEATIEEGAALAAVMYNLAGALGYGCLQSISASLSDLFWAMSAGGARHSDPVLVHARAAMLASPGMPRLSGEAERELLSRLEEVVAFSENYPERSHEDAR